MSKGIRIAIAEDHAIVRKGIVEILKEGLNHPLIDEVSDAESLYQVILKNNHDLVILDINLPGRSGLDALTDLKNARPDLPVLMLSINSAEHYGVRTLKNGASGYLVKDAAPTELIKAVQQILAGKKYISTAVAQKLIDTLNEKRSEEIFELLSDRELEVFKSIAKGSSLKDIAAKLNLSVTTVSTYRARILEKMKFTNNAEIIHYAIENKMV